MKKIRILLAALLVLAMMAPMAMAEEGAPAATSQTQTIIGKGSYADPTSANVWTIKFPTANSVNFTVDPKKLMSQSPEAEDLTIDSSATVLFSNFDPEDDEVELNRSSEIEALTVENQGTTDVILSLNIRPTNSDMIINQSTDTFADPTKPAVWFQAAESSAAGNPAWEFVSAVGVNFSSEIKAYSSAWSVNGDMDSGYTYVENGDVTEADGFKWNSVSYKIKGAANADDKAVWTSDLTPPDLQLTWFVMNKNVKAIPVNFAAGIAEGAHYVMAADRMYALPSDTVTVYVQPSYRDSDSPAGYVIHTDPQNIATFTMDYLQNNAISASATTDVIKFSNGVGADNGTVKYTFNVPGESGFKGFTAVKNDGTTPNEILIQTAPVIHKLEITATSSSTSGS